MSQIIQIIIALLLLCDVVHGASSEELINIVYEWSNTLETIYTVPEGKNLLINNITTTSTHNLYLYDSGSTIAAWDFSQAKKINIVVKDELSAIDGNINSLYNIQWILYNEEDDIDYMITGTSPWINKNVFDKQTVDEIFKYQWVMMIFITLITFILRITWRKQKGILIFWK